jgi:hypothetical protein
LAQYFSRSLLGPVLARSIYLTRLASLGLSLSMIAPSIRFSEVSRCNGQIPNFISMPLIV